jgi:hypothetical protein
LRKSAGARHGKKSDKKDSKAHQEKGQVGIFKSEGRRDRSALRELFSEFSRVSALNPSSSYRAEGTCPE